MIVKSSTGFIPFSVSPDAGAAMVAAHEHVRRYVRAAIARMGDQGYLEADPHDLPEGKATLALPARERIDVIIAAMRQVAYYERQGWDRLDALADEIKRIGRDPFRNTSYHGTQARELAIVLAADASLPFTSEDLTAFIDALLSAPSLHVPRSPAAAIVTHVVRAAKSNGLPDELVPTLTRFRDLLASLAGDRGRPARPLVASLSNLLADHPAAGIPDASLTPPGLPPGRERTGDDRVLTLFKRAIRLLSDDVDGAREVDIVGPDRFPLRTDSPLRDEHASLTMLFKEFDKMRDWGKRFLNGAPAGRAIIASPAVVRGRVLLALCEREQHAQFLKPNWEDGNLEQACRYAARLTEHLIGTGIEIAERWVAFDLALALSAPHTKTELAFRSDELAAFLDAIDRFHRESPLTEGERYALSLLRARLVAGSYFGHSETQLARIGGLIGDGVPMLLAPGPAWVDALHLQARSQPPSTHGAWRRLIGHLGSTGAASRPTTAWSKKAIALADGVGGDVVQRAALTAFEQVPNGYADPTFATFDLMAAPYGPQIERLEANLAVLVGLLWLAPSIADKEDAEFPRAIARVAQWAYKKVPRIGPRAVRVGTATVHSLSMFTSEVAIGQLAMLKSRVKFGTAQRVIATAFDRAAEALGLPRDQIEELGVPTYGLEAVGLRRETVGDAVVELRVDGRDVTTRWLNAEGKPVKSVPAKVKAEHKDDLKEIQAAAKDIAAMLPAQAERLDAMFLAQRTWPIDAWRQRYLDHPLVGTLARRLIWTVTDGGWKRAVSWTNDTLVTADDGVVKPSATATVELWHPIDRPADEVGAWRAWLDRHQVRQPFKQAHREVYPLTEAERRTGTYSNRFAAHVLRQHQFHALCAARGWKNKLRLLVDDAYPPATRTLPLWNLRAEYWIEGIGGDYGTDTTDGGAYLRLVTDQVRFYRTTAAANVAHASGGGYTTNAAGAGSDNVNTPLSLERIPPLVLSEVLRDVDLFVGVASVGNDPTWQDGGPGGRFQTYWQSYSFGALNESATTRKAVLERLLPRLTKLRDKWSLDDKFLIVRGSRRTYKIHLGSGNILMEPNDQYLCIVPDRSSATKDPAVFLPFEGDATLSIILSKAFLLANDAAIKDPTITRQIG
jgi:hypothetical protein